MNKQAAILLASGFEEIEALLPADFLRRAGVDVKLVSVENQDMVCGSHDINVQADTQLQDVKNEHFDAVIAPGGIPGAENLGKNENVIEFLRAKQDQGAIIAAICAAPVLVLAKNGFLNSRAYTCNPGFCDMAKDMVGHEAKKERVVIDGAVVTSQAAGTSGEFAYTLIKLLLGQEQADKVMNTSCFSLTTLAK